MFYMEYLSLISIIHILPKHVVDAVISGTGMVKTLSVLTADTLNMQTLMQLSILHYLQT